MRRSSLLMALGTMLSISGSSAGPVLVVGRRVSGDEQLESAEVKALGPPACAFNFARTYAGDNERVVSQVRVEDASQDAGAAHAAIVAGGPGHTFVTLAYTVPRRVDMRFRVTIYGKLPAFRKIP